MNFDSTKDKKRHNFAFPEKTDKILRKIARETGLKLTTIVVQAIDEFAKKKEVKHD